MSPSTAIVQRKGSDLALMPPPPTKRIKRPATVLDEDEYTDALAQIIARDYFPGLEEAKAQEEYLDALESKNITWIEGAGQRLQNVGTGRTRAQVGRNSRDTRFDTSRSWTSKTPVPNTPRGSVGGETPKLSSEVPESLPEQPKPAVNISDLSLSSYQAKFTSEDNESFNTVVDKQNLKRREKHAYFWTVEQRIPSKGLILSHAKERELIKLKGENEVHGATNEKDLIPLTTGAISSRPAKPDSWRQKTPANNFMFQPESIDEYGLQTVMEVKEAASSAGPKETVFTNTRFPPAYVMDNTGPVPASPSLNTSIIARRDAARANRAESESTYTGGETPRVNGYSFVDEDEPEDEDEDLRPPSYRDLLAGQVGDATPNPFNIREKSNREDLHHRLVENDNAKKRAKVQETIISPMIPSQGSGKTPAGNMTPAARRLMEKLGKTPLHNPSRKAERMSSKDMWTPGATPRRK